MSGIYPTTMYCYGLDGERQDLNETSIRFWIDSATRWPQDFRMWDLPSGETVMAEVDGDGWIIERRGFPYYWIMSGWPQRGN